MPWIPFVEKWYGYRYVENTITDRSFEGGRSGGTATAGGVGAFGNSSDWGVHALGATTGDNSINYQLSVVNGRGFRNLSRSKTVDTEGRFGYSPIEQMVIAVGGYTGKRGNEVEGGAPTRTATRGDAMIAWRDKNGVGLTDEPNGGRKPAVFFVAEWQVMWGDVRSSAGVAHVRGRCFSESSQTDTAYPDVHIVNDFRRIPRRRFA